MTGRVGLTQRWVLPSTHPEGQLSLHKYEYLCQQFNNSAIHLCRSPHYPGTSTIPESWTPRSLNALKSAMPKNVFQRKSWLEPLIASMVRELVRVLRPRAQYRNQTVDEILDSLQQLGEVPVLYCHSTMSQVFFTRSKEMSGWRRRN